jgi:1,4-alpha-glucan branching enzyme
VRPAVTDPAADDPYEVVHDGVLVGDSDVVAFARDLSVAYRVWSPTAGYPGNPWYRDFFARGSFGLHPSWRVTDRRLGPMDKASYRPDRAMAQVRADVGDLHRLLRQVLDPRPGTLVVAAYDTELFGHWWFEGPTWLERMLRTIAEDPALRTTTLRSRLQRRPPTRRLDLPESSWGYAKGHATWVTKQTRPLWRSLREAEERAKPLLAGAIDDDGATRSAREQLARELAQLQCSDWPFMMTRGNSPDYARDRFADHLGSLDMLCRMLASGDVDDAAVGVMAARDGAPADPTAFLSLSGTTESRR